MKKIYITLLLIICIFFCNSSFAFASDNEDDDYLDIGDIIFLNDTAESVFIKTAYSLGYALEGGGGLSSVGGTLLVEICNSYAEAFMDDAEYQEWVDIMQNSSDDTEREENTELFIHEVLELMEFNEDLVMNINDNTVSISEDLASLYQAYLQNNVVPYVVHYSIPINEVPASLFRNAGMLTFIRDDVMTNPDYNADSISENRVGFLNPYTANFVEYYDVSGLSYVIHDSLTMEDYDYSLVGANFDSNNVYCYDSNGVRTASGRRVLLTYGGSSSIPYVKNTSTGNTSFRFRFIFDKTSGYYYFSYFVHASGEPKPILFFRDTTALMEYMSGQSSCYMIPTDYTGGDLSVDLDMDYDEMYEAIQKAIQNGSFVTPSDLQSIIDSAVKEYQQEMLNQLHDINNSLNNESGYSWLRLIYNYLNERLTTTLSDLNNDLLVLSEKMDSVIDLLNSILSGGDGGGTSISSNGIENKLDTVIENQTVTNNLLSGIIDDLDKCYALLEEISALLRQLLDKYKTDYNSLTLAVSDLIEENNDKFPFSLPHDYYLLFSLFESEPITPYFELPIDIDSLNIHHIISLSLAGFEPLGKLSRIFFGVIFIFALIPLTLKIIESNERLVS